MPGMEEHGGGCCGVKHVYGFAIPVDVEVASLDRVLENVCTPGNPNRLSEVVLTNGQMQQGWGPILRARGFRLVARWRNSNSGNVCNMFVMVPTELSMEDADLPWSWEGDAHQAVPAAPAPVPGAGLAVGARVRYTRQGVPGILFGSLGTVTEVSAEEATCSVRWDGREGGPLVHFSRYIEVLANAPAEAAPVAPEPDPEPHVVSTVFVNVYRNGDGRLEHPSLARANEVMTMDRRVRCEERRTLSNGVVEVINHV